jgi:hypothetical protein
MECHLHPGSNIPQRSNIPRRERVRQNQKQSNNDFLPKMGYNRTTAIAIVYGPAEHGGIGIKSLYAEQSIAQITALSQHTRLYSPLGRTIRVNLEWVQIIAGIARPVLEDTRPIQHMEGEWFKSIKEFLYETNSDEKNNQHIYSNAKNARSMHN